jgi:hypothetical protein
MNNKMVNGVVGGAVVEVDRRESESKGCDVFYPFGLAPPGVDTYVLWCVDRGRHSTPPSVAAFSRRCEVERRDGCIVRGRSHESRLRISLAGGRPWSLTKLRDMPNPRVRSGSGPACCETEGRAEPGVDGFVGRRLRNGSGPGR